MSKKKTIPVERIVELANNFLEKSADGQTGERIGVSIMVESVLHDTGNYNGFSYLQGKGIIHDPIPGGMNHTFVDESRRVYHFKK